MHDFGRCPAHKYFDVRPIFPSPPQSEPLNSMNRRADWFTERTELRMQCSIPPRRLAVRGCERTMRSIDGAQRNLRGGILHCIATIINNYCHKARQGNPSCICEAQAVLQFTFSSNRCLKPMRGRSPLEVDTFSFHLGSGCAMHGPGMGFAREGGLQNGYRQPPDAALRLGRRKRRASLPRPQSAFGFST